MQTITMRISGIDIGKMSSVVAQVSESFGFGRGRERPQYFWTY